MLKICCCYKNESHFSAIFGIKMGLLFKSQRHVPTQIIRTWVAPPPPELHYKYQTVTLHKIFANMSTYRCGGVLTWKWDTGMCWPEDPFSHPPGLSPHFIIFQFLKALHSPEITNFWKFCISKPQKWGKVQFLNLKFDQILFQRPQIGQKKIISSLRPQILAGVRSLSPHFQPFWAHTHSYQNERWVPP